MVAVVVAGADCRRRRQDGGDGQGQLGEGKRKDRMKSVRRESEISRGI